VIKDAMAKGADEQIRAHLGAEIPPETPLYEGGLVASPDGLSWTPSA
jgi:halogenation protein CepH